jgi:hypothetical protein
MSVCACLGGLGYVWVCGWVFVSVVLFVCG